MPNPEEVVKARMAANATFRSDRERRLQTWWGFLFQEGPARYIDSITDDIRCEMILAETARSTKEKDG